MTGPFEVERKTYAIKVPGDLTTDLMDAAAINNRGVEYFNQGKFDEAFQEFDRAIQKDPEHTNAVYNRGLVHYRKGRYEQAITDCSQALSMDAKCAKAYNLRGLAYEAMNRHALAIADLTAAVEIGQVTLGQKNTDVLGAMNRLARIYATCPKSELINGEKAVELATQACELTDWSNHSFVDTLAASYAAKADFESAVKWQSRAIELLPEADAKLQAPYQERLQLYKSGEPYREPAQTPSTRRVSSSSDRIFLLEGSSLNGQPLSGAHNEIKAASGEVIKGLLKIRVENDHSPGAVVPVICTPSWGDHASTWVSVKDWAPTGTSHYDVPISLRASGEGTHYIIFGSQGQTNGCYIASLTGWFLGSNNWNDGVDLADMNEVGLGECMTTGFAALPVLERGGVYSTCGTGCTYVKVTVSPGLSKQHLSLPTQSEKPLVGRLAPSFKLKDIDSKEVSLSDFRGKVVLLDFWATWCGPCRMAIPYIEELHQKYSDQGLVVIGLNHESDHSRVKEFAKGQISYPVLLDADEPFKEYGIRGIPAAFYIDREGKIRHCQVGFAPGREQEMEQKVKGLLTTKDEAVQESEQSSHQGPSQVLADFEEPAQPKWNYGTVDAGSIQQEGTNHFFRFGYSRENTSRHSGGASPHAGYSVDARKLDSETNSVLVFRYRTNGISDLRLSLVLSNQRLGWFLNLPSVADWIDFRLPLQDKFSRPLGGAKVESLQLTTFAQVPENGDGLFLDLDDFRLEAGSLSDSEVQHIKSELQKRIVDEQKMKECIRIQRLKTDKSTYTQGEQIVVTYDVVNVKGTRMDVPLNSQYSRPMYLIGARQAWIEPMDDSARTTDFGRAAKYGAKYAAGGSIFPVGKNYLDPGEQLHQSLSLGRDLRPGRYKYYIEMKAIDDDSLMDEATVEFVVLPNPGSAESLSSKATQPEAKTTPH